MIGSHDNGGFVASFQAMGGFRRVWPRSVVLLAVLTAVMITNPTSDRGAGATTINFLEKAYSVSFCLVDTPPDVSPASAEDALEDVIAQWESELDRHGGPAVDMYDTPDGCTTGVDIDTFVVSGGKVASFDGDRIKFNTFYSWWAGIGGPEPGKYSYEGILAHETGHTFGAWHSGKDEWSYDGDGYPTMVEQVSPSGSHGLRTIRQDDRGTVVHISWPNANLRFFDENPGFESRGSSSLGNWGTNGDVIKSTVKKYQGNYSALLAELNASAYITSVYDPWKPEHDGQHYVMSGMTSRPYLQAITKHNKGSGGNGDVTVNLQWAYLYYDDDFKTNGSTGSFSSWRTRTCVYGGDGTTWELCHRGYRFELTSTLDAVAFRAMFIAAGDATHIDYSGARRNANME